MTDPRATWENLFAELASLEAAMADIPDPPCPIRGPCFCSGACLHPAKRRLRTIRKVVQALRDREERG